MIRGFVNTAVCFVVFAPSSSPLAVSLLKNQNFSFMRSADAERIRNAADPQKGLQGQPPVTTRVCCHSSTLT